MESGPSEKDNGLIIDPLKDEFLRNEFDVDVDSPVETMRTLNNETQAVRKDSEKLQEDIKKKTQVVERLLRMEESIKNRINSRFTKEKSESDEKRKEVEVAQNTTRNLIKNLEFKIKE